jgi:hypothetical protein
LPPVAKNPRAASIEEFAARLRELRVQAGSPSYRNLAKITNYSSSTLADATSGKRLPSEPVLKALVSACGADPAPWLDELRRLATCPAHQERGGAETPSGDELVHRSLLRRWAGLAAVAAATFGIGAGAGLALGSFLTDSANHGGPVRAQQAAPGVPPFAGTPIPAPAARVPDGTDPRVGHCQADRRLIDRAPVMRGRVQIGALDLMYSPSCGAGWASLFLYPGEPTMMGEVTVWGSGSRYSSFAYPLVKQVNDYTDVIVPGSGGCLGAYGAVYEAGKPLVTASLPCEAPTVPAG